MRTSIITFDTRARQRFDSLASQVVLHARSGREAVQVEQVVAAVDAGALAMSEAHSALAALRAEQQREAAELADTGRRPPAPPTELAAATGSRTSETPA